MEHRLGFDVVVSFWAKKKKTFAEQGVEAQDHYLEAASNSGRGEGLEASQN